MRPAVTSDGTSIPSATGAELAARIWLAYERPVSAARTRPAAYAKALPSATPPGDGGVATGGDHASAVDPASVREHLDLAVAELDEAGDERQAVRAVVRLLAIARLALEREVADHRDRPRRLVGALGSPRGDGGVVERGVEAEVEPDVLGEIPGRFVRGERGPGQRRPRPRRSRARRRSRAGRRPQPACTRALEGSCSGDAPGSMGRPRRDCGSAKLRTWPHCAPTKLWTSAGTAARCCAAGSPRAPAAARRPRSPRWSRPRGRSGAGSAT